MNFKDKLSFSNKDKKRVVSIRDGVMEYLGGEIGMSPIDKIFKIYRSKETVEKVAPLLVGLPLANEHLDFDVLPDDKKEGEILTSDLKEFKDSSTDTSTIVENEITIKENMLKFVQDGKNELSLDYSGDLIPHSTYDFEQIDITPKFLAIVESGRCGTICNFKDKKGALSMEEILKMINALSDEEKTKLMSKLTPVSKDNKDAEKDMEEAREKAKEEGIKEGAEKFKDSQCFKDAMMNFADERANIIGKAKNFLDDKYEYKGKSNDQIMQDALTAEKPETTFKDAEIGVAFKMLEAKKIDDQKNFADSEAKKTIWTQLKKGEI